MRTLRFVTCDVFTSTPFAGNQLAVVFGAEALRTDTLLAITREFNYSETVFVFAPEDESHTRKIRIFTPARELPFAGHPTLGCAHTLVATGQVPAHGDEVTLVLGEGVGPVPVRVRLQGGVPVHAQLTAAQPPEHRRDVPSIEILAKTLGLAPSDFAGGSMMPEGVSCGIPFLIVPLVSVDAVRRARVDMDAWRRNLEGAWASEPLVFTLTSRDANRADPTVPADLIHGCDVRARVFVPGLSVPEDPATGSANACLAAYLAARIPDDKLPRDGVLRWEVAQGIEMGRPSRLSIEAVRRGESIAAVRVGGASVIVSEGTMRVSA